MNKQRVEVRLVGLPGTPADRHMFERFMEACEGTPSPDGLSFTAEIEIPPDVVPFKGSPSAFIDALASMGERPA